MFLSFPDVPCKGYKLVMWQTTILFTQDVDQRSLADFVNHIYLILPAAEEFSLSH
jgi:hypothetical protein